MFFPEGNIRAHLYGQPVDMRKSFDGLYALTRQQLGQNPLSGDLFVYISRRGMQVKILYFDRCGLCVWSKRLERGTFISNWSAVRTKEMDWTSLKLLLEGIVPMQQRKRFRHFSTQNHAAHVEQALQSVHAAGDRQTTVQCR
jgi:transposase